MTQKTILIAGGSGLIGQELIKILEEKGHQVRVLTRKEGVSAPYYRWDPISKTIDKEALKDVEVIVNLSGAPVAGKRWTTAYKQEIIDSRVLTAQFLYELKDEMPKLSQFVSASGITCYGYQDNEKVYCEEDSYGDDFLSQVVKKWEEAANVFESITKVAKIRTGIVLSDKGGALPVMSKTIRFNVGSPIGTGGQIMPWISLEDIARVYLHTIEQNLEGTFNASSGDISNAQLTNAIAKKLDKPLWLPKVPSFVLKLAMGEMSSAILNGIHISNEKLLSTGFEFKHTDVEQALNDIFN